MKIIVVNKADGNTYICLIMRHKEDNTWSFINLTKGHICQCRFITYQEAIDDLQKRVKDGKITSWYYINETAIEEFNIQEGVE